MMNLLVALSVFFLHWCHAFQVSWPHAPLGGRQRSQRLFQGTNDGGASENEDSDDWRAFRAQLVKMNQNNSTTLPPSKAMTTRTTQADGAPLSSSSSSSSSSTATSWAYDAGTFVEKGSIVLSRVESDLGCHDLRQPYFAKCVVLIVEHEEDDFTQGIILNRPSQLRLDDQDVVHSSTDMANKDSTEQSLLLDEWTRRNEWESSTPSSLNPTDKDHNAAAAAAATSDENQWRLFFGGDISNLYNQDEDEDDGPLVICLHNLTSEKAQSVSDRILPGVYLTSHTAARNLVASGEASADSFFVFHGFCGWDITHQTLEHEVERGSWYVASTDSQSLWDELGQLRDPAYDPRDVGLSMWENLVMKLDKSEEEMGMGKRPFADWMLREWATKLLLLTSNGEANSAQHFRSIVGGELDDAAIFRALQAADRPPIQAGRLLRGSSLSESPFLLKDQFLHKSTVLLLQDDDIASVGMVLNLPTTDTYTLAISNSTSIDFTIRYGGPNPARSEPRADVDREEGNRKDDAHESESTARNQQPLVWLHCFAGLKYMRIGQPLVTGDENGVWTCTEDQVRQAIDLGFATADDFMLLQGFCVWEKEGGAGGVMGQVIAGNLESIATDRIDGAWTTLRRQELLSASTLDTNLKLVNESWTQGLSEEDDDIKGNGTTRMVYGTDVTVEKLADEALAAWVQIYLIGNAEYYTG